MYPSNLRIGHGDDGNEEEREGREGEKEDVEIKLLPGEAKTGESDLESFSLPEPESSRKIEVFSTGFGSASSDCGCALDGSCSRVCNSR